MTMRSETSENMIVVWFYFMLCYPFNPVADWDSGCFYKWASQVDISVSAMELSSLHEATVWLTREINCDCYINLAGVSLWQRTEQCVDEGDNEDNHHIWYSHFQMTVEKPTPKQLLPTNHNSWSITLWWTSGSRFLAITCNFLKAQEKLHVIGFGFALHWLKK